VTAKSWSATHPEFTKVLWWSATSLDVASFAAFESAMSLSHRLPDLLAAAGDSRACVVIDGLDRVFSDTAFANVSALIRGLRLDDAASPWCVLVTCQLEEWGRVQRELARANLVLPGLRVIQVADLPPDDLDPVWREFPALRPLSLRPHLRDLLAKPKILDLLATRVLLGAPIDAQQWVGESDVVAWFWEEVVRTHPKAELRARFLQLLGERQADSLESETPRSSFRVEDLSPVDGLVHDRLCDVHDERLSFCHDLYGDWARQRILVGHADRVGEYIEQRITSPLWHRALRLYGLHLLEQHEDVAQWRSVLNSLGSGTERRAKKRESVPAKWRPVFDSLHPRTHDFNTAQDLVLESVIFAADPLPLLERMWPELQAEGGVLLHRLLARFLHVATLPNPLMLRIASAIGEDFTAEAATMQRVPYWPYWLRMIQFLHNHSADVTQLALQQVAEIADTWLRRGGAGWLRRREAAELGIAAAEHTLRLNREHGTMSGQSKIGCAAYSAGLAGAAELPDRVAAFALDASQRVTGSEGASARDGRSSTVVRRVRVSGPLGSYEFEMPPPWPDGPSERVNEAFRNTCLDTDALHPLVLSDPVVARQVLLALMIQEPREPDESFSSALEEDLEVETMHTWFPPFYLRGPFLFFLQNQATEGLDLILRLVNFATERWADRRCAGNRQPPSVTVPFPEGDREHVGDGTVCFWYRDVGSAPHVVVSALMALEKWLYMQLDEKRPIGDTVRLLLRSSNSLAIVGLLIAVGKKAPALFLDELLPLLAVPEFYRWEIQHQIANEGHQMIGWDMLPQNRTSSEPARHGHSLPHRRISLACVIREACCEGGRVGFGLC